MTKRYFIAIAFALILVFVIGFQVLNQSESVTQALDLEPQTSSDGSVTVIVAPRQSASAGTLEFEITLETHSVELNEDLVKAVVLIADNKNYTPTAWVGDPTGGHHRQGILQFAPISPSPRSMTLKIFGVGGIAEQNFTFRKY